jgi:hypothetical protein
MPPTKLVFISNNVRGKEYFIENLLSDVAYIELSPNDTITTVQSNLAAIDLTSITNIGLIFDNTASRAPFIEYTEAELAQESVSYNAYLAEISATPHEAHLTYDSIVPEFHTSGKFFSDEFLAIINQVKAGSLLNTIDIISCNTRNTSEFTDLENNGIIVRYSSNITGILGDWILESHAINVTPLYFTSGVASYPYRLGAFPPNSQDASGNWIIDIADKMYWLMTYTSNTTGTPNLSSSFILTQDIDMNNVTGGGPSVFPSQSIGGLSSSIVAAERFIGNLYGNNKTVTIRNIDLTKFTGFVGALGPSPGLITSSSVQDLNLIFTTNTFTYTTTTNTQYGLFCGIMRSGTINNCDVSFSNTNLISITFDNSTNIISPVADIGGFIGRKQGVSNITNSTLTTNDITINTITTSVNPNNVTIGGYCGTSLLATNVGGFVSNILNITGNLIINPKSLNANATTIIAGFIARSQQQVTIENYTNCIANINNIYVNNNITGGLQYSNIYIGGFIGLTAFSLINFNNCQINANSFNVVSTNSTSLYAGGFIGIISSITQVTLQNSICNINTISTNYSQNATNTYTISLGGFIGYNTVLGSIIQNCQLITDTINVSCSSTATGGIAYIGGVNGFSALSSTLNNITSTIGSLSVNLNLLDCVLYCAGLAGYVDTSIIQNCSTTIGSCLITNAQTSQEIRYGGLIGYIFGNGTTTLTNNTMTINLLRMYGNSSDQTHMGGAFGLIQVNAGTMTCTNNSVSIGKNALIESVAQNDLAYVAGLIADITGTYTFTNNSITFDDNVTFKANQDSTDIVVNSLSANLTISPTNTVSFIRYPLDFTSIGTTAPGIVFNNREYYIVADSVLTIEGVNFNIDLSDITVRVYIFQSTNVPLTCCTVNQCNMNPQVSNYDNRNFTENKEGLQFIKGFSDFNAAIVNGTGRTGAVPFFKGYDQMMICKQRLHRR